MSTTTSVADFLSGGGSGRSAKFESIGDTIKGTVIDAEVAAQTDFATGVPLTWDNGDPKMQLVITVQTDARDDSDDDGKRKVYLKGAKSNPQSGAGALAEAMRKAGAKEPLPGGEIAIRYTGDGTPPKVGFHAPKLYAVIYTPPPSAVASALAEPDDPFAAF